MMNHWVLWALLSAIFAGLTAILAKIGVQDVNSHLATAIRTSVVLVFTWALALPFVNKTNFAAIDKRAWIFLGLSGIATGLSWICYFRALKLGPASLVAPIDKLSVVFVLILAACFLGETLTGRQWVGAGLIVAGALVLAVK